MPRFAAVLDRLRAGSSDAALVDQLLQDGERLLRAGSDPDRIRSLGREALQHLVRAGGGDQTERRRGHAHLLCGSLERALVHSRAAALAMPYDVDARIVLGCVRLARNELDEAAHEFDEVIGEFGAEGEAAAGRRAAILARGHAPVDELAADPADWREAATLLAALWRICGVADQRMAALAEADPATAALLAAALGPEPAHGPA